MLMSLDQFVFGLNTASFHELQRRTSWKHPTTARVGARNARQYTGQGDDTITLTGLLTPNQFGTLQSLVTLRSMANAGDAYVLVDGAGRVYGAFIIEGINEGQTLHMQDGTPRRVEFTIELARVDDSDVKNRTQAMSEELE
ncbi:phage tail protein [Paraburkholderia sediminicola]|uniref:phage tail protein n=1 Tax=Paraburkholderia sediminicola TaxID=458836 RepID=UPI0038B9B144